MRIVFRPEARAEVLEAKAWYEQQAPGLGFEFARAVEASKSCRLTSPEFHKLHASTSVTVQCAS